MLIEKTRVGGNGETIKRNEHKFQYHNLHSRFLLAGSSTTMEAHENKRPKPVSPSPPLSLQAQTQLQNRSALEARSLNIRLAQLNNIIIFKCYQSKSRKILIQNLNLNEQDRNNYKL